jgi:hypothetical protein
MKQNNQPHCGDCILFEYESAEGTGVCAFHQTVVTCDTEACEDFIDKSPQKPGTNRIETILNKRK